MTDVLPEKGASIDEFTGKIWHCKAEELLAALPSDSVDMIATDPPYHVSISDSSFSTPAFNKIKEHEWELTYEWVNEAIRVLKNNGTFYIWCGTHEISYLHKAITDSGAKVVSNLAWVKTNPIYSTTRKMYRHAIELCLFGVKGSVTKAWMRPDITQDDLLPVRYAPIVGGNKRTEHPTQKPQELIEEQILNSCPPDGIVLDPFMGSGTTGAAAIATNRAFVGSECDLNYCNISQKRLAIATGAEFIQKDGTKQLSLFASLDHSEE